MNVAMSESVSFSTALDALKEGGPEIKIARADWLVVYISFIQDNQIPHLTVNTNVDGLVNSDYWNPTQSDILANDWKVFT